MAQNPELIEAYLRALLNRIRTAVDEENLNTNRLPKWVETASIKYTVVYSSLVFVIRGSNDTDDSFEYHECTLDIGLFFGIDSTDNGRYHVELIGDEGDDPHIVRGDKEGTTIAMDVNNAFYYPIHPSYPYHPPKILYQIHLLGEENENTIASTYLPISLHVHTDDLVSPDQSLPKCTESILYLLRESHNGEDGDQYQHKRNERNSFVSRPDQSVIVLGDYDDGSHERELRQIRDHLNTLDYDAALIKDLPSHPAYSMRQKVKTWCLATKFCIIVDRDPSGHLVEYTDLEGEEVPIALLREEGSGSTWMIGHEIFQNQFIELFEFEDTPLEVLDEVTDWGDELFDQRIEYMDEYYPDW